MVESSAGGDEKEDIMKNNKKLNSIVTMSKEELQEVNGGQHLIYYPKRWINGIPAPECSVNLTAGSHYVVNGMNAGIINPGIMNPEIIGY